LLQLPSPQRARFLVLRQPEGVTLESTRLSQAAVTQAPTRLSQAVVL